MIQLRILGTPALDTGSGVPSDLLAQPKRLALLAYLATAGSRSLMARDKVLALFWPEQPEERARHALNQALHILRRALGTEAIVTRGERLGIDPTFLWCDASAFQLAIRSGELGKALELYRGPLLDGLYLDDAPDFEHWLDATRIALQTEASTAARRLAEGAVTEGDPRALSLARRAAELAPYDSAAAIRLVQLLDADGNSGAAIAAYDAFSRRLLVDCELQPSVELQALIAALRQRPAPSSASPTADALVRTVSAPALNPRRTRRRVLIGAAVFAGAIGLWTLRSRVLRAAPSADAALLGRVAVLPFSVQGGLTRSDSLGRSLVELLGSRLDGAGPLRVVPADSVLAAVTDRNPLGLAAGSVIDGSVTVSEGTLHLHAAWRRAQDRSLIGEVTTEGSSAQLLTLLDRLAIQLLAQAQVGPRHALSRSAALAATSLPALKAYLAGEQDFSQGRFTAASQAFEHATVLDSSFALAQYRLGVTALWAEDYPLAAADAGTRALHQSATLSDRDRRLLQGFDAWRRGDRDTATSRFLSVLANDHDNLEAWFQLGETLFHYNPSWGLPITEARDAFREAIRIDPDHWGALWHLAMLDAYEGQTSELDRHLDHLLHLGPATDYVLEIASLRACAHRDAAARTRLIESLRSVAEGRLLDMTWRCAVYGRDIEGAELMAHVLTERHTVRFAETQGRYLLANFAMAQGKRSQALAQLDSLRPVSAAMALDGKTNLALLPDVTHSREQLLQLSDEWWKWHRQSKDGRFDHTRGRLEAELANHARADAIAAVLDSAADEPGAKGLRRIEAEEIRALAALRQGNQGLALHQVEVLPPVVWFGLMVSSPGASRPWGRFQTAETLASAGRPQDALRWYGSLYELSMYDLIYAPAAHVRRGELYLRLADTAATTAEYARFLELWKDADPDLQPIVASVREKLTRLSAHR